MRMVPKEIFQSDWHKILATLIGTLDVYTSCCHMRISLCCIYSCWALKFMLTTNDIVDATRLVCISLCSACGAIRLEGALSTDRSKDLETIVIS